MGGLDDPGMADSPSVLLSGVSWWWRWGGDYVLRWRLLTSPPSHLAVLLSGAGDTLLPIDSSSPLVRLFVGGRQSTRSAEFPAFESTLLRSGR